MQRWCLIGGDLSTSYSRGRGESNRVSKRTVEIVSHNTLPILLLAKKVPKPNLVSRSLGCRGNNLKEGGVFLYIGGSIRNPLRKDNNCMLYEQFIVFKLTPPSLKVDSRGRGESNLVSINVLLK